MTAVSKSWPDSRFQDRKETRMKLMGKLYLGIALRAMVLAVAVAAIFGVENVSAECWTWRWQTGVNENQCLPEGTCEVADPTATPPPGACISVHLCEDGLAYVTRPWPYPSWECIPATTNGWENLDIQTIVCSTLSECQWYQNGLHCPNVGLCVANETVDETRAFEACFVLNPPCSV